MRLKIKQYSHSTGVGAIYFMGVAGHSARFLSLHSLLPEEDNEGDGVLCNAANTPL